MVKLIRIPYPTIIPYFTSIFKNWSFSNTDIPELNFTFNERTIPITNSHKHLGVTFNSDAKWKERYGRNIFRLCRDDNKRCIFI
jgi:hypothetical protein